MRRHAKRHKHGGGFACKKGFVKQTRIEHKMKHHHKVTVRVTVCVKRGSTQGSGGSSGGTGGSGGSGASGAGGPPIAVAANYGVAADGTLSVGGPGVLANDRGSGLVAILMGRPAHGTLTLNRDGSFSYTPSSGFVGSDSFTYKALDASFNSSNVATVTITVTPLVSAASYTATSGTPLSVSAPGVLAGAVGSGLAASVVAGAGHGTLSLASDGSFTYTATAGYVGSDSFTYEATDGAGGVSNVATVTITVEQAGPPEVTPQSFSGEIANTELQVGGTRGAGPEVFVSGANALSGDTDPSGGTLSATPGVIATAHGGSVTMASNGTFTYVPAAGYEGSSDSFNYQVDSSDGESTQATATIDFASGRVWYVNSGASGSATGTSAAPFSSLSAAVSAASSGDVIFLESGAYTGGVTLGADVTLDGQSAGLVIGSETLLAASGSAPTITNGSGVGLTLGEGDTVEGVEVAGTTGDGILASGINSFTLASSVTVSGAGGDGLDITGGNGTIGANLAISGSAQHSVAISGRTGGTVTLSGAISDTGEGVSLTNNGSATIDFTGTLTANTGANTAFAATAGGTVELSGSASTLKTGTGTALEVENTTIGAGGLSFLSISTGTGVGAGPSQAVVLDNTGTSGALSVNGTGSAGSGGTIYGSSSAGASSDLLSFTATGTVTLKDIEVNGAAGNAIYASNAATLSLQGAEITGSGADGLYITGDGTVASTFDIESDLLTGQTGDAIDLSLMGNTTGTISNDTIGNSTQVGSSTGDGIQITNGAGTLVAELAHDTVENITGTGRHGIEAAVNAGELDLTVADNPVTMLGSSSGDAATYSTSGSSTFCLNTSGNTEVAAGASAHGESATAGAGSTFELQGSYVNGNSVPTFLAAQDSLTGGASSSGTFVSGTCQAPPGGGGGTS